VAVPLTRSMFIKGVYQSTSPISVAEPPETVNFSAHIDNTSVEPAQLTGRVDDIHGDHDGRENCTVPNHNDGRGICTEDRRNASGRRRGQ